MFVDFWVLIFVMEARELFTKLPGGDTLGSDRI